MKRTNTRNRESLCHDIPGLVARDDSTSPKELMLGPLTVEEMHLGFMYLLNHMQTLDISILERFGIGDIMDGDQPGPPIVNTLLQNSRCVVEVKGMKRIFSNNGD